MTIPTEPVGTIPRTPELIAAWEGADVDYAGLLPVLFRLRARRFYIQLAGEKAPEQAAERLTRSRRKNEEIHTS